MSIIRVGLSETQNFAEGWDAIFAKKSAGKTKKAGARSETRSTSKKKPAKKKK